MVFDSPLNVNECAEVKTHTLFALDVGKHVLNSAILVKTMERNRVFLLGVSRI